MLRRDQTIESILNSQDQKGAAADTGATPDPGLDRRRQPPVKFEGSEPPASDPAASGIERRRHPRVKVEDPAPEEGEAAPSGIERRRHPRVKVDTPVSEVERAAMTGADRRVGERRKGERQRLEALRAEVQKIQAPEPPKRSRSTVGYGGSWSRVMKPSRLILLGVALVSGGLAASLVLQRDLEPGTSVTQTITEIVPEARARILVATGPIGVGQRLSAGTVGWKEWPEGSVQAGYVTFEMVPDAISDMSGSIARYEFFPGDPIREQKLAQADQGYLSAVLGSGMRGVSVPITAESAAGGFIVPNDQVDVVLTRVTDFGADAQTILYNVRVMAIDNRLGETGKTGAPTEPGDPRTQMFNDKAIATLALDPRQAEVVISAGLQGDLALVLRSIADFGETGTSRQSAVNAAIRVSSPFWKN
ncbi:MAG: Flp pilus assembly protein CpaB [Alphaproteobacteria bacterium]|nr:Flp pilus assembly protein CpaB [Alphaproteobacteria bacterium]